jgi:hypothetical protein
MGTGVVAYVPHDDIDLHVPGAVEEDLRGLRS